MLLTSSKHNVTFSILTVKTTTSVVVTENVVIILKYLDSEPLNELVLTQYCKHCVIKKKKHCENPGGNQDFHNVFLNNITVSRYCQT